VEGGELGAVERVVEGLASYDARVPRPAEVAEARLLCRAVISAAVRARDQMSNSSKAPAKTGSPA
jgi:hypothetical protein